MATTNGCWINMRGSLWRCSNVQMRKATNDEAEGAEMVNQYLDDLRWDMQKRKGARKYVDVTREGEPDFGDEPDEGGNIADEEHEDAEPEPTPPIPPQQAPSSSSSAQDQPLSEPTFSRQQSLAAPSASGSQSGGAPGTVPQAEAANSSSANRTRSRSPSVINRAERPVVYPYPFDQAQMYEKCKEPAQEVVLQYYTEIG